MVPDWAPHARCWMAWPCREAPWGGGLDEARRAYAEVAQAIARFEPVTMVARPELVAMASLYCGAGITTCRCRTTTAGSATLAPAFVRNAAGELAGVTWAFNGWGELHADYAQDADLARRILEHVGARRYASPHGAGGRCDPGRRRRHLHRRASGPCSTQAQSRA